MINAFFLAQGLDRLLGLGALGLRAFQQRFSVVSGVARGDVGGVGLLLVVGQRLLHLDLQRHRIDLSDRVARRDDHVVIDEQGPMSILELLE